MPSTNADPPAWGDERGEAFDLPLNGVRLGVGAVAAAPAVVDVHGDVLRQQLDRWPPGEVDAVQDPDPAVGFSTPTASTAGWSAATPLDVHASHRCSPASF
jgi:hypothetical protein